jgi:hypothetical protein
MVLLDGVSPRPQPLRQRRRQARSFGRVLAQHLPLGVIGLPRLVQQRARNSELAYVVQQCGPAEPITIRLPQLELLGD